MQQVSRSGCNALRMVHDAGTLIMALRRLRPFQQTEKKSHIYCVWQTSQTVGVGRLRYTFLGTRNERVTAVARWQMHDTANTMTDSIGAFLGHSVGILL